MFMLSMLLLLSFSNFLGADPWGKDADLCTKTSPTEQRAKKCQTPLIGAFGELLIAFHQNVISPCDGPRSNFLPSSSQYTLEAMRKYGFFSGVAMGCDRLMRENDDPWVYKTGLNSAGQKLKLDPVP